MVQTNCFWFKSLHFGPSRYILAQMTVFFKTVGLWSNPLYFGRNHRSLVQSAGLWFKLLVFGQTSDIWSKLLFSSPNCQLCPHCLGQRCLSGPAKGYEARRTPSFVVDCNDSAVFPRTPKSLCEYVCECPGNCSIFCILPPVISLYFCYMLVCMFVCMSLYLHTCL